MGKCDGTEAIPQGGRDFIEGVLFLPVADHSSTLCLGMLREGTCGTVNGACCS